MVKIKSTIIAASLLLVAQSASAVTIDIYNFATQSASITSWLTALPTPVGPTITEDFENIAASWNTSLVTNVGTFTNNGALPGSGATSYQAKVAPSSTAYFELRDYNDSGRFNTTAQGTNYLDSADITKLNLEVISGINVLYFWLTDPSDVGARTTTSTASASVSVIPNQPNGSLYFVGIKSLTEDIQNITWTVSNNGDGFGLDDFTASSVPEPGTIVLLGAGLLGLGLFSRRRMNK